MHMLTNKKPAAMMGSVSKAVLLVSLVAWSMAAWMGCAAGRKDMVQRLDASDADLGDRATALERSLDAAYDRERALAERLRRLEEAMAVLQANAPASSIAEVAGERNGEPGRPSPDRTPDSGTVAPPASATFDVAVAYAAAYKLHQAKQYDAAQAAFTEIVGRAPTHALADNAQYWIGEAHYGLGRYRQAVAAFERVLAFEATEKDDDAQLMMARSYLSLGEKTRAIDAFRQLLKDYDTSEYVDTARKELRYLEGP